MATKERRTLGGRLGMSQHQSFQTLLEDEATNFGGRIRKFQRHFEGVCVVTMTTWKRRSLKFDWNRYVDVCKHQSRWKSSAMTM